MERAAVVYLVIGNGALREALSVSLGELGTVVPDGALPGDLARRRHAVVSTTLDMSPGDCRHLAARGAVIAILATMPGPLQESTYRKAGAAAYLPMGMASYSLAAHLRPLMNHRDPC
jgi:hypothetical protein